MKTSFEKIIIIVAIVVIAFLALVAINDLESIEQQKQEIVEQDITSSKEYKWHYSGDRRGQGSTGDVPDGVDWGLMRDYCHTGPVITIVTREGLGETYHTNCTY